MKRSLAPALVLVAISGIACAALSSLFRSGDHIRVSHERHTKAKVECIACHETIFDQKELGEEGALPKEAKCMECHRAQKEKGNCQMCHSDPSHPATYEKREPHLRMNHSVHLAKNEDCTVCHKDLPEPWRISTPFPEMASCNSCHEHQVQYSEARCDSCHVDLSRYPIRPVSAFTHEGNWLKRHPLSARSAGTACGQCHEQTFCIDCHGKTVSTPIEVKYPERLDRQFIHRNDWISRHTIERSDPALCSRCHSTSFCVNCHQSQSLTPSAANPRNPHPQGFAFPGPTSHASAARQDISSCAACHDQGPQSVCISCHKVGGVGGNPHPPSFLSRHKQSEINSNSMCLYCHQ